MLNLQAHQSQIQDLCRTLRVRYLDVFGSALTDDFGPESDVDVLVEFDRRGGKMFDRLFDLKEGLEALFGRPVDVVIEKAIRNPYFRQAVDQSRQRLYAQILV